MQNALTQFMQFLQSGISSILRLVEAVWVWTSSQVQSLATVPWSSWPIWKQIVLAVMIVGIAVAMMRVLGELWAAGSSIVSAFATLVGVFIRTLPNVAVAGLIAVAGLWVLNNVDLGSVKLPISWQTNNDAPAVR